MKIFEKSVVVVLLAVVQFSPVFAQTSGEVKKISDSEHYLEMAVWTKDNKEAFEGVTIAPYEKPNWGYYTQKGDFVYAHVFNWPADGKLIIDREMKVRTAFLNYGEKKLSTKLIYGNLTVALPTEAPNKVATVIKIELTPTEDWANFDRYRKANASLKAPSKNEDRVVFIGNSITDNWTRDHGVFFESNPSYVNRGISGQTSSQMLLRFRPDVIDLKPKVVIISAGTNDIAGNRGVMKVEEIAKNIFSMAELAKQNNIKVILASVLPASSYSWSPSVEPAELIVALNKLIKSYASSNNLIYLDYYTPMVNKNKGLKEEIGRDTVHPNAKGYDIMEPLVQNAISKALKKK
ncbi:SGNH/GDSL hydrolase family protein [Flavobacterium algicola]|uniref:SGNH/GDSL hydrolase family protein n=1 Tax=Flavobacterium algicola TaxID=556529 RepID=UPI001EFDBA71|nr:SGNH/GDSL hydrolase family protein [Flavobacterium algicola]MCG9793100.1 GDSL-type esterase/lipase family protein [Flavobacterium algicola]